MGCFWVRWKSFKEMESRFGESSHVLSTCNSSSEGTLPTVPGLQSRNWDSLQLLPTVTRLHGLRRSLSLFSWPPNLSSDLGPMGITVPRYKCKAKTPGRGTFSCLWKLLPWQKALLWFSNSNLVVEIVIWNLYSLQLLLFCLSELLLWTRRGCRLVSSVPVRLLSSFPELWPDLQKKCA